MRILSLVILLSTLAGCSSTPTVFPEEQGITCYQTEEQAKEKKHTCLRVNSFNDPVKWHRVRTWETLPDIPDLP